MYLIGENHRSSTSATNLEIQKYTISPTPGFPLTDHYRRHCYRQAASQILGQSAYVCVPLTFLPQFWLALLHRTDEHIAHTGIRKPVQMRSKTKWLDNEQALRPTIVGTIQNCPDWKTQRHPEFVARCTTT
jgi:hypothetical protein